MTIVKPCRRRDAFTAAKTSRRLISEFVKMHIRLAWHQDLCSGCFFTHVRYLCADTHLLHTMSVYTLFFVEHTIETYVFAYKLLWKIKIAMYENLWLYTKSSRTGDWNCNQTKWNMCQCSGYNPFCTQASSWSPSHWNHLAVSCFSLGAHAVLQWLWFVFVTKCQYKPLGGGGGGGGTCTTTPCWLAVVCLWLGECDMHTNTMLTCSGLSLVTVSIQTTWLGGVWHAHQHHAVLQWLCVVHVWLPSVNTNHLAGVCWGHPNTMLTCSGCGCMRFVFGYRVSIQTTWLGGVWHAHQHHDPHPQAEVRRPGTLSTDQTAHTQVPQTLVFCAICYPFEHTEWFLRCCWCRSTQSEFWFRLWAFMVWV